MKAKIFGGLLIAVLAVTSVAEAQTHTPVVNNRQHKQEQRIHHGVRSGQLTHNEARNLQYREHRLANQKRMAKANGHVSPAERNHLRREQNRLSYNIYNKKHNRAKYN